MINTLREAATMLAGGRTVAQVLQATFNQGRNQYGGMKSEEAKRLKELEIGNARLKRLVAFLPSHVHGDGRRSTLCARMRDFPAAAIRSSVMPDHIPSDNGSEFIATKLRQFLKATEIETLYIDPDSP